MKRLLKTGFAWVIFSVIGLALFEGIIALLLAFPVLLANAPRNLLGHMRALYTDHVRHIVTADSRFSRFDPELLYTLRTGRFVFSNKEFSTEYEVNQLGVRDDEASTVRPEIIVIGDSMAMGWGVGQNETFPQLIEKKTGLKTLNTGVASYGTVRELLMLNRTDTSRLRYLVIQYCNNDFMENEAFFKAGNRHFGGGLKDWEGMTSAHMRDRRYYPGRYTFALLGRLISARAQDELPGKRDPLDYFLNALARAGNKNLKGVKLIAFEINSNNGNNPEFPAAIARKIKSGNFAGHIRGMKTIDMTKVLFERHYFVLDDHLNRQGHEAVADAVIGAIRGDRAESRRH